MQNLLKVLFLCLPFLAFTACNSEDEAPRGELGESCQARNDCGEKLACIRETCLPRSVGMKATGKECYRIECKSADDCCTDFFPDANCDQYKADCEANPDDCMPFNTLCKCQQACEENLCVPLAPACITDDHCFGGVLPYCTSGRCVQCRTDTDCGTDGFTCLDGACTPSCSMDTDCPMMHRCIESSCVETGCSSDRECAFLLEDHRAVCDKKTKACQIKCSSSLECDQDNFEVCDGGQCVFVGCSSDLECRDKIAIPGVGVSSRVECR